MSTSLDSGADKEEERSPEPPPPALTGGLFHEWRSPRLGAANPERLNNPLWEWLIRSRWSAYQVNAHFGGPSAFEAGPGWCFDRFGQSSTLLPDGRVVLIAGEHEDSYDPDFFIYNDVVVRRPDGTLDIYGYPTGVFPPTDFHSATLVGERIVLIGSLGYSEQRQHGRTPVHALNLHTFAISRVITCGTAPGWIHSHTAMLADDGASILIQGGKIERSKEEQTLVENIDEWRLHLEDWRWERLTARQWPRWEVRRRDGKSSHLWMVEQALWYQEAGWREHLEKQIADLRAQCGKAPDLALAGSLYRPNIEHEQLPEVEGEYQVHRIRVQGVVVRYVGDMHSLQATVEGDLPRHVVEALTSDLLAKVEALENAPCELQQL